MNEVLERAIKGVVDAAIAEDWEEVTMRLPQLIAVTDFPEHHYETPAMEGLVEALRQMAAVFPPDDWEYFDSWGDYQGYGEHGGDHYVDEVDQSNSGDVHSHGIAVGGWFFAKDVRKLLAALLPKEGNDD